MKMGCFENQIDFMPWLEKTETDWKQQEKIQKELKENYNCHFGKDVFVSELSNIYGVKNLTLGDKSIICAESLFRDIDVTAGVNCSFNTHCYLQGKITIGDNVRIAPKVSIIAMNHGHQDPYKNIVDQEHSFKGITIGDDVWIGAGAVILDGVNIGSHTIVAAGAIVTKDIPEYSIAGGNPAKVLRDRRTNFTPTKKSLGDQVQSFSAKVKDCYQDVIKKYYIEKSGMYSNIIGGEPTVRPICDAVEVMAMFEGLEALKNKDEIIQKIQSLQSDTVDYNVLTVGYSLEVLGSHIARPFGELEEIQKDVSGWLLRQGWNENPWYAGDHVDCLGTATYQNKKYFNTSHIENELFGWLNIHANPVTGMWGSDNNGDFQLPVNGFYRLTRGTYAQFGMKLPYPEVSIDTILRHSRNTKYFNENCGNACNVLDIIHPLWLCAKQTNYRKKEGEAFAQAQIKRILSNWQEGLGFSFELEKTETPTLQGLEMWLSILYLLCDYVGISNNLCYRPKGVHRLENPISIIDPV